ncbi:MAG: FUSC family protein [Burkholderiales bacterium]|nr:FUSC family protein [Burkholderiales bacterium]
MHSSEPSTDERAGAQPRSPASPAGLWRRSVRVMLHVDRAQLHPLFGLKLALGVVIPLVAGIAGGRPELGAFASAGALGVGFCGFLGVYRTKAATMIAAAVSITVSLFVGSVAGHSAILTTMLVLLWGFGAGLLGVFGPAAYVVGLQAVLNLLVGSGFPASVPDAAARALIAFAGGLLQTLLVVGVWPLRHFVAERRALADVYRTLARYADGAWPTREPPPSLTGSGIYSALADPHPFADRSDLSTFQRLLDEAERIRVSLAALAAPVDASRPDEEAMLAALPGASAALLDEIASAVQAGRAPAAQERAWQTLRSVESALRRQGGTIDARPDAPVRSAGVLSTHVGALLGPLRVAWRTVDDASSGTDAFSVRLPPVVRFPALSTTLRTLRASLTLRSSAFRHALRVAIVVASAAAFYQAMARPNGYWLPVAALLVLQPGFSDTFTRGLGMMSGTVVGAVAATLIASTLRPEQWMLAALIAVIAWSCFTTFRANYALFAACITAYIVFLVSLFGLPQPVAALNRAFETVIGASLALFAYAVWPTWESRKVPERLAAVLEAQAAYAEKILSRFVSADGHDDRALAQARLGAQLARSNAEESVERMLGEPESGRRLDPSTALGILAAVRTFAVAGLTLDAARRGAACPPWPALRSLAGAIEHALVCLAASLRADGSPPTLPPLREMQRSLADRVEPRPAPGLQRNAMSEPDQSALPDSNECPPLYRLAISETALMVDSVDTMAGLLVESRKPTRR